MQTTENLGLKKPDKNEFYDVNVVNDNMDTLDALFEKDENGTRYFDGTASGNLPLDGGGTVKATNIQPLTIYNTGGDAVYMKYRGVSDTLGYLGFSAKNKPTYNNGSTMHELLHTGNKPTGTYTGTGASRTVSTGGIGNACLIYVDGDPQCGFALAFPSGCFTMKNGGTASYTTSVNFKNGVIGLSLSENPNTSGVTYNYQVL
jgi:hypothetical protein